MTWIVLEDIRFKAPVGVSEEEKKNKNDISIDLSVRLDTKRASREDDLSQTVDYAELYQLTKTIVLKGSNLLEYLAAEIGEKILGDFPAIQDIRIKVHKHNPPIGGDCSKASVRMRFKR